MLEPKLRAQIKSFLEIHESIETLWLDKLREENIKLINMNSVKVVKAQTDINIIQYIVLYSLLLSKMASYIATILYENDIERVRAKEFLSITLKLKKYIMGKNKGEIIFHKCLNDLLGIRIVLQDYDTDKLISDIKEAFPAEVKAIDSSKEEGYKAVHIYTGAKLGHFKWEMQIWREADYDNNIKLHESYKRDYIEELKIVGKAKESGDS